MEEQMTKQIKQRIFAVLLCLIVFLANLNFNTMEVHAASEKVYSEYLPAKGTGYIDSHKANSTTAYRVSSGTLATISDAGVYYILCRTPNTGNDNAAYRVTFTCGSQSIDVSKNGSNATQITGGHSASDLPSDAYNIQMVDGHTNFAWIKVTVPQGQTYTVTYTGRIKALSDSGINVCAYSAWVHVLQEKYRNTLCYNANGGSGAPSSQSETKSTDSSSTFTISSTTPTRSGYAFKGWSKSSSATSATYTSGGSIPVSGTETLYAVWADTPTEYTYTITFNANGGSGAPSSITKTGTDSSVVMGDITNTIPTRSGYVFKGWSASSSWSSKRIAYNSSYGGSAASDGTTATTTYGSWTYATYCSNTGGSTSSRTLTLYAQWEAAPTYSHTLSYNANGGTGAPSSSTVTNTSSSYSMTVSSTVPTRTGYTFAGWSYNGSTYWGGNSVSVGANATVTLTAQWEANTYTNTLNYNANGGSGAPSAQTASVTYPSTQSTFTVSTTKPTRTGYTFDGWYTAASGGTKVGTTYTVGNTSNAGNQSATIYAQWKINTYSITYNGNGATGGNTASQTFNHGSSVNISANGFTRTGYEFAGWSTKADGSGTPYNAGNVYSTNANLTLYAQWRLVTTNKTVNITWDDNSNNVDGIPTGVRPSKVTVNLTAEGHPELNQTVTVTGDNSVPATSNEWTYSFNGLQKYDTATGAEIQYSVTENQPSCLDGSLKYNVSYSSDTWNVTNELAKQPVTSQRYGLTVEGTVTWKDENDKYHFRPDKVYVDLYRNDTLYETVEMPEGTTTYEFTGLDKIDSNFKVYKYTIVERSIDNYEIKYNVYSTSSSVTAETGDVIVTTTLHSDITNTFTPDKTFVDRFGNNVFSMQAGYTDKDGNIPDAEDIKGNKPLVTLKQLTTIWRPVDAENGVYTETYGSYSGNEVNLIVDGTVTVKNIPYGKYEIAVQNDDNLTLKDIEELASRNAVFSYENDKYYVTYSYEYEEAREDLGINMLLKTNQNRGYSSEYSVNNYFSTQGAEFFAYEPVDLAFFMEEEHNWDSSFTVDKEPTCTEDGIKSIHCKDCTLVKDITIIKALSHDIKDGECTRCGRPIAQEVFHIYYDNDVEDTNEYHTGDEAEILSLDKENFIGWSTKKNAEEAEYMAGDTITIADEDIKLYAVFEESPTEEESSEEESSTEEESSEEEESSTEEESSEEESSTEEESSEEEESSTEQETSETEENSESESSIVEESSTEQDSEIEEV